VTTHELHERTGTTLEESARERLSQMAEDLAAGRAPVHDAAFADAVAARDASLWAAIETPAVGHE